MPGTRKLGRTSDSRNAMMRAMVTYLLENGKIETTVTDVYKRQEQIIFPEIEFEKVDAVRGMDVCFVTTAKTDEEGKMCIRDRP